MTSELQNVQKHKSKSIKAKAQKQVTKFQECVQVRKGENWKLFPAVFVTKGEESKEA